VTLTSALWSWPAWAGGVLVLIAVVAVIFFGIGALAHSQREDL
jgi:hypothetical protein